jgi:AAA domain-containing protein
VAGANGEATEAASPYSEAIRLGEQFGWVCVPLYERDGRWVPPFAYSDLLEGRYSLELVEKLWDGHEEAPGIGAIWPRDVVAAEADSDAGEAWLAGKKLPRTPTFSSRRGPHYLFRGNGNGLNPAPADGVEVLSRDGGKRLMTLPPTAGKRWWPSLDPTASPFATLPASLAAPKPKERERAEITAKPIPEGRRNTEMARIVGKLCATLPPDAALAAAVAYDGLYCIPPLGRARIERMVGDWADESRDDDAEGESWGVVDLAPVLEGERVDHAPRILRRSDGQHLLYPGKTHLLSGPYESLKTWLALKGCAGQMALERHVLYVDFEDDPDVIVDRLRELGVPDPVTREFFHYVRPDEPLASSRRTEPAATAVLDATIDAHPYTLAIVDGLTEALALHGISMNDNTEIARFNALLPRRLVRHGAAALTLDHVPHEGNRAIGAQHKMAGLSGAAYLIEPVKMAGRDGESVARLTVKKDRPGYVRSASAGGKRAGDVHVHHGEGGFIAVRIEQASDTADPLGLAPRERRVLEALHGPEHPVYPRQVGDRVVEMGWTAGLRRETVSRSLTELVRRGLADEGAGAYWRVEE